MPLGWAKATIQQGAVLKKTGGRLVVEKDGQNAGYPRGQGSKV